MTKQAPPNLYSFDDAKVLLLRNMHKFLIGKFKNAKCYKSALCIFDDWEILV